MPFGRITVATDDITTTQEHALVTGVTRRLATDLKKKPDVTVIHLNRVPAESWFIDGQGPDGVGVHIEVSITAGSNSEDEKSDFIKNVHELVTTTLPSAASTIYVPVHELAADAYGYGGVTQAVRHGTDAGGQKRAS